MNQQYKNLSVRILCELFGKSRLAYYDHQKREGRKEMVHHAVLELVTIIREDLPRLGSKKLYFLIKPTLEREQIKIGRDAFHEMLRKYGMTVKKKRFYPKTTWSEHWLKKYPNLIKGIKLDHPNQLWVSDITYIRIVDDFNYLSLITDAYSHRIVGYNLSESLSSTGALNALKMALTTLPENSIFQLIHHSDRGVQYCSSDYTGLVMSRGILISMTEDGDPRENAIAERVNGILKNEMRMGSVFKNRKQALEILHNQIEIYNSKRPHLSCNYLTPDQAHQSSGELKRRWTNYYKKKLEC